MGFDIFGRGHRARKRLRKQYEHNLFLIEQEEEKLELAKKELALYEEQFQTQYKFAWDNHNLNQKKFRLEQYIYEGEFQEQADRARALAYVSGMSRTNNVLTARLMQSQITNKVLRQRMIYNFNVEVQQTKFEQQSVELEMLYERTSLQIAHEAMRQKMAGERLQKERDNLEYAYKEAKSEINSHFSGFGGFLNNIALPALGAIAGFGIGGLAAKGLGFASGGIISTALGISGAVAGGLGTWQRLNGQLDGGLGTLATFANAMPSFAGIFSSLPNLGDLFAPSDNFSQPGAKDEGQSNNMGGARSLSTFDRLKRSTSISQRSGAQQLNYGGSDVMNNMLGTNTLKNNYLPSDNNVFNIQSVS